MPPDEQPPRPSRRAEQILLAMFAAGAASSHTRAEVGAVANVGPISSAEVDAGIEELRQLGLATVEGDTFVLTLAARSLVSTLAAERLTPNILRQRTVEQQAEALLIWGLTHSE